MPLLLDTGPLVAMAVELRGPSERARRRKFASALTAAGAPWVLIPPVLSEAHVWMVGGWQMHDAFNALLRNVALGRWAFEPMRARDLGRAAELDEEPRYGFTDAALAAVAERMQVPVLTTNGRHFARYGVRFVEPK